MKQKQKTHSGASKRFKLSGNSLLKRRSAYSSHLLGGKSENRKRRYAIDKNLASGDAKNVKKMLGI